MVNNRKPELVVALDVNNIEEAGILVEKLSPLIGWFKVGSRLFTAAGPKVCELVKRSGAGLFLDLKFHDIPNTVRGSVESALGAGADMLTVHTAGGIEMMTAAAETAASGRNGKSLVVGVTVLTHIEPDGLAFIYGSSRSHREMILALARLAVESGLDGIVASALELQWLREELGGDFLIVTPGIRLGGTERKDDQKRIATPERAVEDGSDFLVVGRPIIAAPDAVSSCQLFLDKMNLR